MELVIRSQLLSLLLALLMGAALAFVYTLLRPVRDAPGSALSVIADAVFCALAAFASFCFAMRSDSGSLGTWEIAASLTGFLLYLNTMSSLSAKIITEIGKNVYHTVKMCKNIFKKFCFSAKRDFQNKIE